MFLVRISYHTLLIHHTPPLPLHTNNKKTLSDYSRSWSWYFLLPSARTIPQTTSIRRIVARTKRIVVRFSIGLANIAKIDQPKQFATHSARMQIVTILFNTIATAIAVYIFFIFILCLLEIWFAPQAMMNIMISMS